MENHVCAATQNSRLGGDVSSLCAFFLPSELLQHLYKSVAAMLAKHRHAQNDMHLSDVDLCAVSSEFLKHTAMLFSRLKIQNICVLYT